MAKKYLYNGTTRDLEIALDKLIEVQGEPSLRQFFLYLFKSKVNDKLMGKRQSNRFIFWFISAGRSGHTGIFFPVFAVRYKPYGVFTHVWIRRKMNRIGATICAIPYVVALAAAAIWGFDWSNLESVLIGTGFVIFAVSVFVGVPLAIYLHTSSIIRNEIAKKLRLQR